MERQRIRTQALAVLLVALATPLAGASHHHEQIIGGHADADCDPGALVCGSIVSTMDGCTTAGHLVAAGASSSDDTVWHFRYVGYGYYGRYEVNQTSTGHAAVFRAHYAPGLGIGYWYGATLRADGEIVASSANTIRCA